MGYAECPVKGVVNLVVAGGDGDGLFGVPGRGGEGEGLRVAVGSPLLVDGEAGGCGDGYGDVLGRAGVEADGVGCGSPLGDGEDRFGDVDAVVVVVGYGDLGGSGSGGAALQAVGCVQLGAAGRG